MNKLLDWAARIVLAVVLVAGAAGAVYLWNQFNELLELGPRACFIYAVALFAALGAMAAGIGATRIFVWALNRVFDKRSVTAKEGGVT